MGAIVIAAVGGSSLANPTTYTGSLSVSGGGLIATGVWNDPSTTMLSWVVDDTTTPGKWHYSYTLTVKTQGISHIIIEASDGDPYEQFTIANLFSPSSNPPNWILDTTILTHIAGGGANPTMPEDMYGIKFNAVLDATATTLTLTFDSDRVPVWGDFYSKDGKEPGTDIFNTVYNAGFGSPDSDPANPPGNGSVQNHLLVPDTYIPAPGAFMLVRVSAQDLLPGYADVERCKFSARLAATCGKRGPGGRGDTGKDVRQFC